MTEADRDKWNARYRDGAYRARTYPSEFLVECLPELPRGRALDVAAGAGRNSLFLASEGYVVDAVDISSVALERLRNQANARGLPVHTHELDLDSAHLPPGSYAVIVMIRYTNAELIPRLLQRLDDGGYFICEEHLVTDADVVGPSDPAFRVRPGELRELVTGLDVRIYREALVTDPDGRTAALARLAARKARPGDR